MKHPLSYLVNNMSAASDWGPAVGDVSKVGSLGGGLSAELWVVWTMNSNYYCG